MPDITPLAPIRTFLEAPTAPATALALTTILQGAEANPAKIGDEYMPEVINPESLILPTFPSLYVPPSGAIGLNAGEVAVGDGQTVGGVLAFSKDPMSLMASAQATQAEIIAAPDNTLFVEAGRIPISASEAVAGKVLRITGTITGQTQTSADNVYFRIAFNAVTAINSGFLGAMDTGNAISIYAVDFELPFTAVGSVLSTISLQSNSTKSSKFFPSSGDMIAASFYGEDLTDTALLANDGVAGEAQELVVGMTVQSPSSETPGLIRLLFNLQFQII